MREKLEKIKLTILSGEAALSEMDKTDLVKQFNSVIDEHKNLYSDENCLADLKEIFENIYSSNLADLLAKGIDSNSYFELGNSLLSIKNEFKDLIHGYLNLLRNSNFLAKIDDTDKWAELISSLIDYSNFTFNSLFDQRVRDYGNRQYLRVIKHNDEERLSWNHVDQTVNSYEKALINLIEKPNVSDFKIAFLMENSPKMALLDFACLKLGVVNIMIPANSVADHILFILNECESEFIFVQNEKQLYKINQIKPELKYLRKIILVEGRSIDEDILSFDEFIELSKKKITFEIEKPRIGSLATIMYTSGTTGEPKGIMFSHKNLIYKRFCRALALPEIGDKDRFLCYLPLFHTFGRFLELMGSFFWGAQYAFMENPSVEAMLNNMKMIKPTVFISIPKKWIQLYEWISSHVNVEVDDEEVIKAVVLEATGGELKYGLSAAGFLPPEIFRFFQRYDVELMSGFGMTEATGGITMTPPKMYRDNSLGKALPGISIKLADDGELLIKGEYVMIGYFNQSKDETFIDGWFPTGDIMVQDDEGFIEIVDRKKEIYKNIKGETIAPQKIENFFRDFETVKQVFLVGDHRPYNTVLIYPNYENKLYDFRTMSPKEIHDYFSSIIVSINKFLAPFERILDFQIIDRPFSLEYDELTPKGTYKRRNIEKNFEKDISSMYHLSYVSIYLDDLEIRIPNWFLREKGCLNRDIVPEKERISIPKQNISLSISIIDRKELLVKIGSFIYQLKSAYVDFQALLTTPMYWLGNYELIKFTGNSLITWARKTKPSGTIKFISVQNRPSKVEKELSVLKEAVKKKEFSIRALNAASLAIQQENLDAALEGFRLIRDISKDKSLPNYYLAIDILSKPVLVGHPEVLKEMVLLVDEHFIDSHYCEVLNKYLSIKPDLIDKETALKLTSKKTTRSNLIWFEQLIRDEFKELTGGKQLTDSCLNSLYNVLEALCAKHPTLYHKIRRIITNYQIQKEIPEIAEVSKSYRTNIRNYFRRWLGANQTLAVDPETGDEYEWSDVIIVDESISEDDRLRLVDALTNTPMLREAIFLFSRGKLIRLNDILPGGIWISQVRDLGVKRIYRASVQTRFQGSFNILLNLIDEENEEIIHEEINWLILAGTRSFLHELVEDFGGYWSEYKMWTANYLAGESVYKYLKRESKNLDENSEIKLYNIFPFFVWNASAAYFNFWKLTDFTLMLGDAAPENFIVPPHDYQQGTKVISLSNRKEVNNLYELFSNFYDCFVGPSFQEFEFLTRESVWYYIYSGLINSLGIEDGIELLNKLKNELESIKLDDKWEIGLNKLKEFLKKLKTEGYLPKQLYFAIKRFHRWFKLNSSAEPEVQAQMLAELYDTYNLSLLEETYPAVRIRFFQETVFVDSKGELKNFLSELLQKFNKEKINYFSIQEMISESGIITYCSDKEKFFLTRLSYPHLRPEDTAEFVNIKGHGKKATNLVIQLFDVDGNAYSVRNPVSPKEIAKLHQLFLEANLPVNFRPEHDYLVAISERGYIIGGLYFIRSDEESYHMEKIVVSNAFRRKGVSEGLMNEFFNRARGEGVKYVTTGFFRPEYFYKFGFNIAPKYSGLVKKL